MSAMGPEQDRHSGFDADPVYVHKPSLMGAPFELRLRPDALEWRAGRQQGRIPYGRVTRIRLSFRPLTMQTRRFVTEIWWTGGPRLSIASTSWRSLVEQAAQDQAYGAFVRELHARVAAAGAAAAFETGTPPLLYWPGLAVFAAVSVTLAVLTVYALEAGAHAGAALVGGFLGLFLWQSGGYFRRNRPGRYRPQAPPSALVPD
ncbi:MAG TPA: hypothetical protein VH397_08360 [Xanthobacteraceae bacterium]